MTETAKWNDLMKRRGRISIKKDYLQLFWREIQTNPDWQIVIYKIERNWASGRYDVEGISMLFEPLSDAVVMSDYQLAVTTDSDGRVKDVIAHTVDYAGLNPAVIENADNPPMQSSLSAMHETGSSSIEFTEPDIQSKDLHDAMVNFGKACAESVSLPDWMLGKRDTVDDIGKKLGTAVALDDTEAMDEILGIAEDSDKQAPDPLAITRQLLR